MEVKRERGGGGERERETLSGKKIILYLSGILAGTAESEPKLRKNINSRNLK
jgi:hypothetical protein